MTILFVSIQRFLELCSQSFSVCILLRFYSRWGPNWTFKWSIIKTYYRYGHFWIKGFLNRPACSNLTTSDLPWCARTIITLLVLTNTAEKRLWHCNTLTVVWLLSYLNSVLNCWCSFIREKSSITLEFHSEWVSHSASQGTSVIAECSANSRARWVCACV